MRFDFLDGYRGTLALIVVIAHAKKHRECEIVNFIVDISRTVAVDGFFVLSSFLLTHRLLTQFDKLDKSKSGFKEKTLIILQYLIRRFFRIYLVFVLYATSLKFGPKLIGGYFNYERDYFYPSWLDLVTLQSSGRSHLWTIAPELKYYLFIPVLCLITNKFGRFKALFLLSCLTWSVYNEKYNVFNLKPSDFDSFKSHLSFKTRFSVFLYGSIAAIALNIVETSSSIFHYLKHKPCQIIINFLSIGIVFYGLRFKNLFYDDSFHNSTHFETISARIWSLVIFLMVIGHPNTLTRQFSRSEFLKSAGKYSFGIYLLHPIPIVLRTNPQFYTRTQTEFLIVIVLISYASGYLFFNFVENNLIIMADFVCLKVKSLKYFNKI